MEIGDCRLCLSEGVSVHHSHFMPRSLYPLFRAGNLHPVRFSREKMAQTSEQIKDYVFCGDCEKTFNREGESWIHTLFATLGGPFPLRERLLKQAPISGIDDVKLYAAGKNPEIDVLKLTHFGCGVFFKSAVHSCHGDPESLISKWSPTKSTCNVSAHPIGFIINNLQPHRTVVRRCAWDKSRNMCISQVTGHRVQKTG